MNVMGMNGGGYIGAPPDPSCMCLHPTGYAVLLSYLGISTTADTVRVGGMQGGGRDTVRVGGMQGGGQGHCAGRWHAGGGQGQCGMYGAMRAGRRHASVMDCRGPSGTCTCGGTIRHAACMHSGLCAGRAYMQGQCEQGVCMRAHVQGGVGAVSRVCVYVCVCV